jgi:hypothetical protein
MALAYVTPRSSLKGNASLKADIVGGIDWLYAHRYDEKTPGAASPVIALGGGRAFSVRSPQAAFRATSTGEFSNHAGSGHAARRLRSCAAQSALGPQFRAGAGAAAAG